MDSKHHSKAAKSSKRVNPYRTLPTPTSSYILLLFQLANFPNVYRTVKVPLNYTFAHLHTLIQYLFGWSNSHLHQANVYTHVQMHTGNHKIGTMERYGCPPTPPDYMVPKGPNYEFEMRMWNLVHSNEAHYEVVPKGGNRLGAAQAFDCKERVEDQELTLGMVWDSEKERNVSKGKCDNTEIGIIYEYDLCASWMVHITLEHESDFFNITPAMNLPVVVSAKGAPPIEDVLDDVPGEIEANMKTVNTLLFAEDTFSRYCNGEIWTHADKTELAVVVANEV